jgi:hypothetical protein
MDPYLAPIETLMTDEFLPAKVACLLESDLTVKREFGAEFARLVLVSDGPSDIDGVRVQLDVLSGNRGFNLASYKSNDRGRRALANSLKDAEVEIEIIKALARSVSDVQRRLVGKNDEIHVKVIRDSRLVLKPVSQLLRRLLPPLPPPSGL